MIIAEFVGKREKELLRQGHFCTLQTAKAYPQNRIHLSSTELFQNYGLVERQFLADFEDLRHCSNSPVDFLGNDLGWGINIPTFQDPQSPKVKSRCDLDEGAPSQRKHQQFLEH